MTTIRILIVETTPFLAEVISSAFNMETGIEVVGYASDASEIRDRMGEVDVLLMSARLPGREAFNMTREIADEKAAPKIVIYGLTESHDAILAYIEAGASGYVLRDDSFDKMIKTVKFVSRDQALASPNVVAALMQRVTELSGFFQQAGINLDNEVLTARELEILEMVAEGLSNQQIAENLYISYGTVKNHVHNILSKLEVKSRKEAAACLAFMPA